MDAAGNAGRDGLRLDLAASRHIPIPVVRGNVWRLGEASRPPPTNTGGGWRYERPVGASYRSQLLPGLVFESEAPLCRTRCPPASESRLWQDRLDGGDGTRFVDRLADRRDDAVGPDEELGWQAEDAVPPEDVP